MIIKVYETAGLMDLALLLGMRTKTGRVLK
jgi:hypothetical protein